MSRALTLLVALFIPLGCVGVVVSALGGLYALAALNAALTGFVVFVVARGLLGGGQGRASADSPLVEKLFPSEPIDPIKAALGQLAIFAVMLVVVIDGSGGLLWPLITLIVGQSIWLFISLLRRRSERGTQSEHELKTDK